MGPSVTETEPVPSISIDTSPQAGSRIPPVESLTTESISSPSMLMLESITWNSILSPYLSLATSKPELRCRKTVVAAPTSMTTTITAARAFHLSPNEEIEGIEMTNEGWSSSETTAGTSSSWNSLDSAGNTSASTTSASTTFSILEMTCSTFSLVSSGSSSMTRASPSSQSSSSDVSTGSSTTPASSSILSTNSDFFPETRSPRFLQISLSFATVFEVSDSLSIESSSDMLCDSVPP